MKGCQPFRSWGPKILGLDGLTYIWTKIESKIMRLDQVMGVHGLGWAQSCIELAKGVFGLDHIDPVYKHTLYLNLMDQKKYKIIFSLTFSLFLPLSLWSSPHPRTKKLGIFWPPPQKGKKGGARNQRPPFVHAPVLSAPSWLPKKSFRFCLFIFWRLHQVCF